MKVLLIEDEAQTARSVGMMLKALGHDCDWAGDGETGAARALSREHDVILLDIMLPGIDGYDVLQQLRTAEVNTPVIMQSGLVERAQAAMGLGLGASDYLIKPYGKEELAVRMETALERARFRAASAASPSEAAAEPAESAERLVEEPVEAPTEAAPEQPAEQPLEAAFQEPAAEAAEDQAADTDGNRRGPRHAVIKTGKIVYRASTCVMDCVILNLSDHGAALQPKDPLHTPKTFTLKIHFGPTYRCAVCWRYRNKLGVRFLNA